MMRSTLLVASAIIVFSNLLYADADGPDFWRVEGVAEDDVLNIRTDPNPKAKKIGEIAPGSRCIKNLGCVGGLTLEESSTLTAAEKAVIKRSRPRWCNIEHSGITGWVHARYLREGSCATENSEVKPPVEPSPKEIPETTPPIPEQAHVDTDDDPPPPPKTQTVVDDVPAKTQTAVDDVPGETAMQSKGQEKTEEKSTTSDTSPAAKFRIQKGKHHPRGEFMVDYAPNAEVCADLCSREPRCIAFDYNIKFEACWLKNELFPVRDHEEYITGVKEQ